MAVGSNRDLTAGSQVVVQRKQPVAEIGLCAGTENGNSALARQCNDFFVIHVRRMHETPVITYIEILKQPAHRATTVR